MTIEEMKIINDLETRLYEKSKTNKEYTGKAAYLDACLEVLETIKQLRKIEKL
jgi:hypothetical protein